MSANVDEDIPNELVETSERFSATLDNVEDVMKRLIDTPRNKLLQELTPLEVAKLDLVSAYSINSLFWMVLITQGVNPRTHEIKGELDRIKSYVGKVKEIEDRGKAPKLQKEAAKRFVRNAMFDLDDKNKKRKENEETVTEEKAPEKDTEVPSVSGIPASEDTKQRIEKEKPLRSEKKSKNDRKRHSNQKSNKRSKKSRNNS